MGVVFPQIKVGIAPNAFIHRGAEYLLSIVVLRFFDAALISFLDSDNASQHASFSLLRQTCKQ